jgi:beta-lactamase regulating signal transducer with metallopeptidase domain
LNKKKGMNADIQAVCNELISALIQGGAQGGLIIGLIWACLKLCPRANAATRHAAWFATLLVAALLPAIIFLGSFFKTSQPEPKPTAAETVTFAAIEPPAAEPGNLPRTEELELETIPHPLTDLTAAITLPAAEPEPTPAFVWQLAVPNYVAAALVACWLLLATIRLGVLAAQLVLLRRIKRTAFVAPDSARESFDSIVLGMGMSRKPQLLISDKAAAPMVVGFLRPAMLLPKLVAERCSSFQLDHLFRHELAHLARRDDWTNLLQQLIAAIFFFHPGIVFVSRRLTAEREIACDDHALAISRAPREYALFLTEFASQMKGRDFTAAPAAWSSKSQLKERIGMILNGKRNASPRVSRAGVGALAATAATLAIATMILTPRFVVAAAEPEALPAPAAPADAAALAAPVVDVAVAVEPVKVAVPAITVETTAPDVTIASVTTGPRKKDNLAPSVDVHVAPKPVHVGPMKPLAPQKIAGLPQPEPEPRPRVKPGPRPDREDGDLERRIDRLERMVEDLLKRDKQPRDESSTLWKKNFNQDWNAQFHNEMEKGRREAERAQRDVERAVREQKMAMENHVHTQRQQTAQSAQAAQSGDRESLKARRQSLEARRKQIEKELEAIEKEIQRDDDGKEKRAAEKEREREREKRHKADEKEKEKLDKKSRDTGKDSDDGDKAK